MVPVDNEIKGRLALVTGASGGIGAACARELFGNGARLVLTCSSKETSVKIKDLADELMRSSNEETRVSCHVVDMASTKAIEELFEDLDIEYGQAPDIIISNAGTAGFNNKANPYLENISLEEFDFTININLRASFLLCKLAMPHMVSQGWGRIVFVSSISAIGGGINGCHYAASKAGMTGLMKNLASKHAKDGVTLNDVAPAMIGDTGMIPDEKRVEGTPGDVKNIPVGRLGTPQECANVVLMLSSLDSVCTQCLSTKYPTPSPPSQNQRDDLAESITAIHSTKFTVPRMFINVIYTDSSNTPTYVGRKQRKSNRIVGRVRRGSSQTQEDFNSLCHEIRAAWARIVHPETAAEEGQLPPQDLELRAVFITGELIAGLKASFPVPLAGDELAWAQEKPLLLFW
ncbi:short chain dehydrogenase [Colletotrichum salicis]|uniref:Short chain dehydrogenase n=1 Tax=Colletotrichum salicis TaxID=1209931 RepID=A0A135UFY8_9PEZI|nr:short chain dehydrogenase [Colletotrichum salicis]